MLLIALQKKSSFRKRFSVYITLPVNHVPLRDNLQTSTAKPLASHSSPCTETVGLYTCATCCWMRSITLSLRNSLRTVTRCFLSEPASYKRNCWQPVKMNGCRQFCISWISIRPALFVLQPVKFKVRSTGKFVNCKAFQSVEWIYFLSKWFNPISLISTKIPQ